MELKEELEKYLGIKKSLSYKSIKTAATNVYAWGSLNYAILIIFVRQLALMINSGVTVMSGLDLLYRETENIKLRTVLTIIRKEIKNGSTLYNALAGIPGAFSPLFINMIKAGETGEKLKPALDKLADLLETDLRLEKKLQRVTIYPLIILFMTTGVILFIITFILPVFIDLFEGMDLSLPLTTKIMIGIVKAIRNPFSLIPFISLMIIVTVVFKSQKGKILCDRIKLNIPVIGPLNKKIVISRFCSALGALISSNIPVMEALDIAAKAAGNRFIAQKIEKNNIYACGNIAIPLSMIDFFPPMIYQMLETGKENSELGERLYRISDAYNTEIELKIKTLLPILEGILILGAGLIIGWIILSVFMPGYQHG